MKIIPLGGAKEVGATSTLLKLKEKNILIDCGIRMNTDDPKDSIPSIDLIEHLDLILLTHAHMDHSGALPVLHSKFPDVPIYCTNPTHRLIELLLNDALKIMKAEQLKNEGEIPLYDGDLVEQTLDKIRIASFSEWIAPVGIEDIKIYFHPAGHILGAASVYIQSSEGTILFSGDISVTNQNTLNGASTYPYKPDVIVMESTYGDRVHVRKRKEEEAALAVAVGEVIKNNGSVLIPAFAVGRAQEVLLILKNYQKNNLVPKFPVYVDGMIRSVCDIYENMIFFLSSQLQKYVKNSRQPLFFQKDEGFCKVLGQKMRDYLPGDKPCCIISSSGMMTGGPSPLYAKKFVQKQENAIFLTGYQDEESPGRKLLELKEGDTVELDGERCAVKCKVSQYNLSAHADSNQINQIISYLSPRAVILVHGNESSVEGLASLLKNFNVWRPGNKETIAPLESIPAPVMEKVQSVPASPVFHGEIKEEIKPLSLDGRSFSSDDLKPLWKELLKITLRVYAVPELVRLWFGEGFTKEQRKSLEQTLFEDTVYFEKARVAKKWVYRPRTAEELKKIRESRIDIRHLKRGTVIVLKEENQQLNTGIFTELEETGEYFRAITKGKKNIKRYIREAFLQDISHVVSIDEENESYWKIYLRNQEKYSYQYYSIISASEAWKGVYKEERAYSFKEIGKRFFGDEMTLPQELAVAVRLNANDIFFSRNTGGEYIPKSLQEVSGKLNKPPDKLEQELELYSLVPGTVLKVKPVDELSKEPFEFGVFTGDINAKGFVCLTKEGKKNFWFSKYISRTDKIITIENRTEEEVIEELKMFEIPLK